MGHVKIGAITLLESLLISALDDAYGEEVDVQEPEARSGGIAVALVRLSNGQFFQVIVRPVISLRK